MVNEIDYKTLKYNTLKYFWGFDGFRNHQEEIIDSILNHRDTIALLPTGGGKSLCYQLPAILQQGVCIVISPLLALMKDQVNQLKRIGIEAEYLSSELDEAEAELIYNNCKDNITKLLFISPERLTNSLFLQNIGEIELSFIAVDEAHCISEWGQDFRPSYQNIKEFRNQYKNIPCLALTATATPKVLQEIEAKLNLNNAKIFQKSFKRENLNIIIDEIADKYQRIYELLKYNPSSGIIYTRTRKEAEELSQFLKNKNLSNVDFYHAGLSAKEKNKKQKQWLNSNHNILIATNAFGMGIDKDNVRFVIHFSPSSSIENYYQEIGRAGRDGAESFVYLLWNKQELKKIDDIIASQIPNKKEFENIISFIYSVFQVAEGELPEQTFQLNLDSIKRFTNCSFSKIKNVLTFLHNQEIIFHNDYKSPSILELKIHSSEIDQLSQRDSYFLELLLRNIAGLSSQKVHFNEMILANKLQSDFHLVKERIRDLQRQNILEYIDGSESSIKFLKHRNSRQISTKYWHLFEHIQKNKIQKWEEMKFLITDQQYCKMRLILTYFGEQKAKNCGKCVVCQSNNDKIFGNDLSYQILKILSQKPSAIEEIVVQLSFQKKEDILETLIDLLDSGKVKMLNYKTYTLA